MIDRTFIDGIVELADPVITEIDGKPYSTKQLHPVLCPAPSPLAVRTLTAVKDYVDAVLEADGLGNVKIIIRVEGPEKVLISSPICVPFFQRDTYLVALPALRKFQFNQYLTVEQFIIAMQTYFVQGEATASIIKLVGNLTDSKTTNFNDDGVTQQVTAKAGIARVENVQVPNPVKLAPYRTFLEIEQPESLFVFRIQGQEGRPPSCALFEADGGNWELEAMARVRNWLKENLPEGTIILA